MKAIGLTVAFLLSSCVSYPYYWASTESKSGEDFTIATHDSVATEESKQILNNWISKLIAQNCSFGAELLSKESTDADSFFKFRCLQDPQAIANSKGYHCDENKFNLESCFLKTHLSYTSESAKNEWSDMPDAYLDKFKNLCSKQHSHSCGIVEYYASNEEKALDIWKKNCEQNNYAHSCINVGNLTEDKKYFKIACDNKVQLPRVSTHKFVCQRSDDSK